MNVGSRVIRTAVIDTRRVPISARSSAGIGGPARCSGVRGSVCVAAILTPASQVGRGVAVAVSGVSAGAGEDAIGQLQVAPYCAALSTNPAGGVPPVSDDEFTAAPSLLVLKETAEFGPTRIGDSPSESVIGEHPVHEKILDDEPIVSLDQRNGYLVQEMPSNVCDVFVVAPQFGCGRTAVV